MSPEQIIENKQYCALEAVDKAHYKDYMRTCYTKDYWHNVGGKLSNKLKKKSSFTDVNAKLP